MYWAPEVRSRGKRSFDSKQLPASHLPPSPQPYHGKSQPLSLCPLQEEWTNKDLMLQWLPGQLPSACLSPGTDVAWSWSAGPGEALSSRDLNHKS